MPIAINGSGPITGASTLTLGTSTLATPPGSAPSYLCRAWVNFNGAGTSAIRASGNVTSITDNGTGDYTVNFTASMPDADYCVTGSSGGANSTSNGAVYQYDQLTAKTTSLFRIATVSAVGSPIDTPQIAVSVFR